ncbi:hypothetical protein SEA_BAUER_89 [Arthrobacter phage Bauer]|uniref:Bacteriophage T5 Orf172 DNA-binding domain-containing protein n=1 Tax=Arthrobacter phage Bauer TaxID=2985648 RepID=A0A9E7V2P3_9CAUD|nr:hypothetical protein QEO99_gp89 [Arthrobacter phage Bauer]UYM26638.1 hypothetical protein SEA_BAUER_89 [Arthrobacter phage Bauer]
MTSEAFEWVRRNRPDITAADVLDGACGVEDCNQPQLETFPVCEQHAFDIWFEVGFFRMDMRKAAEAHVRKDSVEKVKSQMLKEQLDLENYRADRRRQPGTVYYLQIGDHIKIGYTTDLDVRLAAYPPMAKLLATHPGTRQTEASMHQRFAVHLADRREWFRASPEIESHIQTVREQFKQDRRVTA